MDTLKAENRLQSFIDTLTKLDQKLVEDRTACKRDVEDAARSLKWLSSSVGLADSNRGAPFSRAQATSTSHIITSSSTAHPHKLTDREHKYLETYNGCKKCCGFYMPDGHACEFPSGDGYVERSMTAVNDAHKQIKLPTLPIPQDEQGTTVNGGCGDLIEQYLQQRGTSAQHHSTCSAHRKCFRHVLLPYHCCLPAKQ